MRLSAYDTFRLYMAIKNHFTKKSYDYFKYNGKTTVTQESFLSRRDKHQFAKLCRLYDDSEMRDFLVANFLQNEGWVGDLLQDDAKQIYQNYLKVKQSLTYQFTNDIEKAFNCVDKPSDLFSVKGGQIPKIVELYMQGEISIQTIILLNQFIGFFDKFDEKLDDDFIWPKLRMKCNKLLPFMEFDKEKIKSILKDRINAHI